MPTGEGSPVSKLGLFNRIFKKHGAHDQQVRFWGLKAFHGYTWCLKFYSSYFS